MKQKLLCLLAALAFLLPARLSAFEEEFMYTYRGITLLYEVTDEDAKTCMVAACSRDVSGALVIPDVAKNGTRAYSVTSIRWEAFYDCSGLTSAEIPNSITSIGEGAFAGCSGLTSVEIPNSVTSIGESAFEGCSGLKKAKFSSIKSLCKISFSDYYSNPLSSAHRLYIDKKEVTKLVIPETVTSIGSYAFCGGSLNSVEIPNSVTEIGEGAFEACTSLNIAIFSSIESLCNTTFGNYTANPLSSAHNLYIDKKEVTNLVIPETVTSIGSYAFCGSGLTSVEIPNSVTEIAEGAFCFCSALEKAEFSSIESLCNITFGKNGANPLCAAHCLYIDGKEVTEVVIPETVTSIGGAFEGCSGLTSVVIPNSVTSIGSSAFSSCSGLTSVEIPNSVTSIGESAFYGCSGLTSVMIGNSVQSIGNNAFWHCSGLTSVEIPNSVTEIGAVAFSDCRSLTSVVIPDLVTSIGRSAFDGCSGLTSVVIGNSVTEIGRYAFSDCRSLTSVVIPDLVTSIGEYAFSGCSGLTSVKSLPKSPAKMNGNSFEGLYDSVKLSVPDESVNNYLATNWSLFNDIQNNSGNELGSFSDGVLEYRLNPADMTATVIGAKSYSNLQIPERFTDDSDPANPVRYYIKGIGYKAFDGKGVNSVEFNSRSQMEYIGSYAFERTDISSITLPKTVKSIGDFAFYETSKLSNVEMKEGLESIGMGAFSGYNRSYVTRNPLYLPSTVKSVGISAFENFKCSQVEISHLTAWYNIDFGNRLANPLCDSSDGLYVNGEKLTILEVPEDIKEIKPYAFYNCRPLEEVKFPEGLEKIGAYSFYRCQNVKAVTIPASVVEIGSTAFEPRLREVIFADGLLPISFGEQPFYNGVTDLYLGRPVLGLPFSGFHNLSSLTIGGLITEIPEGLFKSQIALKSCILGSSIQTIGDEAFSGCTSLEEVILPPSVETIGASAFAGDSKLESIIMGHSVKTIGEKAFDGCKASTVSITAQTPPTAPNNTFSNYTGKLYLQGEKAKDAYYDAFTCWDRFDSYVMIEAEEIKVEGTGEISGEPGDTFQLTASIWPENVTLPQIFWRSTNPEIATVDENGLVTLHADLKKVLTRAQGEGDIDGTCTIIAETLYNDGPVAQVTVDNTGFNLVESIPVGDNGSIDYSLPYDVYNMNGLKVGESTDGLSKGIYIIRQGKAAVKTVVTQ